MLSFHGLPVLKSNIGLLIIEFRCFIPSYCHRCKIIKLLVIQSVDTNICERVGHPKELTECKHGTVPPCHYCNKSECEVFNSVQLCVVLLKSESV